MGELKKAEQVFAQQNMSRHKGRVGEARVDARLRPWVLNDERQRHRQINNLILVDEHGKSHQIDRVEIRPNGIFCIEIKNYTGWILGGASQEMWTQYLPGGQKQQFFNPLKQNQSHVYHLSCVLGKKYRIHSVVVMAQNNADKVNLPNVVDLNNLRLYLKGFDDGTTYSSEEIESIYRKLLSAAATMSNEEHIQNIKKTQAELKEGICPRCGKQLVLRNGKYGAFLGCSGYPECSFTCNKQSE